jgi:hypothetical protein
MECIKRPKVPSPQIGFFDLASSHLTGSDLSVDPHSSEYAYKTDLGVSAVIGRSEAPLY